MICFCCKNNKATRTDLATSKTYCEFCWNKKFAPTRNEIMEHIQRNLDTDGFYDGDE